MQSLSQGRPLQASPLDCIHCLQSRHDAHCAWRGQTRLQVEQEGNSRGGHYPRSATDDHCRLRGLHQDTQGSSHVQNRFCGAFERGLSSSILQELVSTWLAVFVVSKFYFQFKLKNTNHFENNQNERAAWDNVRGSSVQFLHWIRALYLRKYWKLNFLSWTTTLSWFVTLFDCLNFLQI